MKKIVFLFLFCYLIASLISCSENDNSINNSNAMDSSYFPLKVGNEWIYEKMDDTSKFFMKVTGTIKFKGKEYYILKLLPSSLLEIEEIMYLRTHDGIKFYEYKDSIETLYRDFSDIITDSIYNTKYRTRNIDSIEIPLGKYYNCKNVEDIDFQRDGGGSYFYAKGIGLIKSIWFKGKLELIEFKLN